MLVLDDLQWVDRSTRQLLLYLLAGLGDLQLSVLAAIRAEALQGAHPLRRVLTELRRLRSVRVVDLAPLDRADTDRLAAAVVGRPLTAEAAEQVWQRSGGNPFVVEELARDLRDGRDGLSDTLREIFLARVDALPQHAHAVVHAVAAGVEPVEHWLLAQVRPAARGGADRRGPGRGGAPAAGRRRRRLPAAAPAGRRGAGARAAARPSGPPCTAATPRR